MIKLLKFRKEIFAIIVIALFLLSAQKTNGDCWNWRNNPDYFAVGNSYVWYVDRYEVFSQFKPEAETVLETYHRNCNVSQLPPFRDTMWAIDYDEVGNTISSKDALHATLVQIARLVIVIQLSYEEKAYLPVDMAKNAIDNYGEAYAILKALLPEDKNVDSIALAIKTMREYIADFS